MSLLGVDIGTTGCKVCAFSVEGQVIASAHDEYEVQRPQPGWAELDSTEVWDKVKQVIARVAAATSSDPITALAVASLGEAVVPVTHDREILGPSVLNFDERGAEYLSRLTNMFDNRRLYSITGNTLGNHFSLTKLLWIQDRQPQLFDRSYKFLPWESFASFMLGASAVVDFSLANRTLLFDLERETWSKEIAEGVGFDVDKLPETAPSGTVIGTVAPRIARELGLPRNVAVVTGAHDQCANAVGCGAINDGQALFGMGTYICIAPVYSRRREPELMIERGLNTEHHAAPGKYVSFIYNHGGSYLKWYRDTFAAAERRQAAEIGADIYAQLIAEMPDEPSAVTVLPHFAPTGPPEFISDSSGVMTGLRLETTRGEILKGILEGVVFYLRECVESLPPTGIEIDECRAVGGGSKSDKWIQMCADILGLSFTRPRLTEAGALGAAILAGSATGIFKSVAEGVRAMVRLDKTFDPNPAMHDRYQPQCARYKRLFPVFREYLHSDSHFAEPP